MNITDVGHLVSDADEGEDKMLKGAKREHKTVMEIAKYYTDAFFGDCDKLNVKKPETIVPATSMIDEYIKMVEKLIAEGHAYVAGGNVYFDTSTIDKYYVFNEHDEEDLEVGVRDDVFLDTNKKNKADFVLWFTKSKFEDQALKWDSPWGVGYPGWHIECSAISLKYLGEYLDIHCGGIDNAFPHHTNEIAQSEAYVGHEWCKYWFHVLHLNDETGKMSKSKGEFLTVDLLEKKGYKPVIYRFFCLQSHYRKNLTFTYEALDNAKVAYDKLVEKIAELDANDKNSKMVTGKDGSTQVKADYTDEIAKGLREKFVSALSNDLNTSMGITVIYDVLKAKVPAQEKWDLIKEFDSVLSLDLIENAGGYKEEKAKEKASANADVDPEILKLVEERTEAKKNKDFARADAIRDELAAQGITLKDTPQGVEIIKK